MLSSINSNINFKANLKSPKLKLKQKDFFIKIRGYGRNNSWADQIVKTTDFAVNLIQKKTLPENVLKVIVKCKFNRRMRIGEIGKRLALCLA